MNKIKLCVAATLLAGVTHGAIAQPVLRGKLDSDITGCLIAAAFANNESAIQKLMSMAENKGEVTKNAKRMAEFILTYPQDKQVSMINGMRGVCEKIGVPL